MATEEASLWESDELSACIALALAASAPGHNGNAASSFSTPQNGEPLSKKQQKKLAKGLPLKKDKEEKK